MKTPIKFISICLYVIVIIYIFFSAFPYFDNSYHNLLCTVLLDTSLILFIISGIILIFSQDFPHAIWLPLIGSLITPFTTLLKPYSFASLLFFFIPTSMIACCLISVLNKLRINKKKLLRISFVLFAIVILEPYVLPFLPE